METVYDMVALDKQGYYRAVIFSSLDEENNLVYNVGVGACGCLYDSVTEGFTTIENANEYVADLIAENEWAFQ